MFDPRGQNRPRSWWEAGEHLAPAAGLGAACMEVAFGCCWCARGPCQRGNSEMTLFYPRVMFGCFGFFLIIIFIWLLPAPAPGMMKVLFRVGLLWQCRMFPLLRALKIFKLLWSSGRKYVAVFVTLPASPGPCRPLRPIRAAPSGVSQMVQWGRRVGGDTEPLRALSGKGGPAHGPCCSASSCGPSGPGEGWAEAARQSRGISVCSRMCWWRGGSARLPGVMLAVGTAAGEAAVTPSWFS